MEKDSQFGKLWVGAKKRIERARHGEKMEENTKTGRDVSTVFGMGGLAMAAAGWREVGVFA